MSEPMTRGYLLERIFSYIETHYDEETSTNVLASVPPETLALRPEIKSAEWYARGHSVELLRAIARLKNEESAAYNDLLECGRYMSNEATNTYLKVLMKLLTPALFAKKIPSFWERDNTGGNFDPEETQVSDRHIRLKMVGVEGFDHSAPLAAGFCDFVLQAMGKEDVQITQHGWSLESPGPESYVLEMRWS